MEQFTLSAFGAFVGAFFAMAGSLALALIARLHSHADRRRELLIEAYSDFLTGLAQRAAILTDHSERTEAATALLVAGKQKMTAYAPAPVVTALAAFEETPLLLSDARTQAAMVALVLAMRQSVGVEARELETAIRSVLFGGLRIVK